MCCLDFCALYPIIIANTPCKGITSRNLKLRELNFEAYSATKRPPTHAVHSVIHLKTHTRSTSTEPALSPSNLTRSVTNPPSQVPSRPTISAISMELALRCSCSWININEVIRTENDLEFSVGIASADFPIDNFYVCPQCGCGLNCDGVGGVLKLRSIV
ncbi:hypothetical protein IEQ34_001725 [Dendrobium chrysotoxum]|uniref:Uncharacterized protein n=1 Tax=Dendrobium chrysotoxum TaxID=161865 RepID=A0AAV7HP24_DENCH|nr:hypothetical protein IEQ34_001725 [Dendrobium chrysotoxum]